MLTLVGVVGVKSSAEVLREKPVGGESGVRGVEMALGGIGGGGGVRWLRGETSGGVPGVEAGKPLLRPPPLQPSPSTPSPTSCSHPNMADDGHCTELHVQNIMCCDFHNKYPYDYVDEWKSIHTRQKLYKKNGIKI